MAAASATEWPDWRAEDRLPPARRREGAFFFFDVAAAVRPAAALVEAVFFADDLRGDVLAVLAVFLAREAPALAVTALRVDVFDRFFLVDVADRDADFVPEARLVAVFFFFVVVFLRVATGGSSRRLRAQIPVESGIATSL
ncbi:MAG: hypothetical protein ACYSXF_07955, partial [Planctomycetota bacterium]